MIRHSMFLFYNILNVFLTLYIQVGIHRLNIFVLLPIMLIKSHNTKHAYLIDVYICAFHTLWDAIYQIIFNNFNQFKVIKVPNNGNGAMVKNGYIKMNLYTFSPLNISNLKFLSLLWILWDFAAETTGFCVMYFGKKILFQQVDGMMVCSVVCLC